VRREDRAREIEVMRQRCRAHRETLQRLAADAPTDALAVEYTRLVAEVERGLAKLDELEGLGVPSPSRPPSPRTTSAGDRPLAGTPSYTDATPAPNPTSRVAIILVAGLIVLGAIAYLIWRGSERKGATRVVEQPTATAPADTAASSTAPVTTQTTPIAATVTTLKVTPLIADYGVIRKGTRAVRQFDVVNNSATPITLVVARSACRCLFYEYNGKTKVAPKGKERITVTVDGGKAPAGNLHETLAVTAKEDSSVTGELTVQAVIR
jgi:hypothetical protein